jgi:hypothetical protein
MNSTQPTKGNQMNHQREWNKVSWKVVITEAGRKEFVGVRTKREGLEMIAQWRKTSTQADDSIELRRNGQVVPL